MLSIVGSVLAFNSEQWTVNSYQLNTSGRASPTKSTEGVGGASLSPTIRLTD